jgi:hypothetical protein
MFLRPTLYTIFLAVGSSVEVAHLLQVRAHPLAELFYIVGFLVLIFSRERYEWIWYKGFFFIGMISLGSLIFQAFDAYSPTVRFIDSALSLWVYIKCLVYLNNSHS